MTGSNRGLEAAVVKHLDFYTLAVTFACGPSETVVLTGPSGSGKTTLLRCLAGLETIDDGFINFRGNFWNNVQTGRKITPQARGVGFLSQDYALFPHMTVSENVMFAMNRADDAGELLNSMGISHLGNKRPSEISGGERQRAALCQTLARRPRLLLLDEPFSALDRENRHALRQKLLEVQVQWGLPIVQVTHDLAEALTLSTRIISLRDGREDHAWLQRQKELFARDMRRLHQGFTLEASTL
jgi:molybdate transport system ATP-binding protein